MFGKQAASSSARLRCVVGACGLGSMHVRKRMHTCPTSLLNLLDRILATCKVFCS